MKISLVLATVGRVDDLRRLLCSLSAQTDHRFEVIVVDQNADDRLLPILMDGESLGVEIEHFRLQPPSLSGARNLGLTKTRGEIVAFPDDDCWYEPNVIETVLGSFLEDAHRDGVIANWVEQTDAMPVDGNPVGLSVDAWRCFRGGHASSISLFLKKELLVGLNGFDERFGVGRWFGAAEETDLILRALSAGASLVRLPGAKVHHHFTTGFVGSLMPACRAARARARGTGGLYAKHRLAPWVVLRGLIAPIVTPLVRGHFRATLRGAFVALGRVEGLVTWTLEARR